MPRPNKTIEDIKEHLATLAQRSRELAEQADALQKQIAFARGTRDLVDARVRDNAGRYSITPGKSAKRVALDELHATIRHLITERPMLFRDLVELTKADENQIKGVLMRLQRENAGVVNLGNGRIARWFIPSAAILAKLTRPE